MKANGNWPVLASCVALAGFCWVPARCSATAELGSGPFERGVQLRLGSAGFLQGVLLQLDPHDMPNQVRLGGFREFPKFSISGMCLPRAGLLVGASTESELYDSILQATHRQFFSIWLTVSPHLYSYPATVEWLKAASN